MGIRIKIIFVVLAIATVGFGSFAFARTFLAGNTLSVEAEPSGIPGDDRTGGPRPQPFVGTINGITFFDEALLAQGFGNSNRLEQMSPKCRAGSAGNNVREASLAEGELSRVRFVPTYMPLGASAVEGWVSACEDDVISKSQGYRVGTGYFQIARMTGPPWDVAGAPRERLKAVAVAGRPGVGVHLTETGRNFSVYFVPDSIFTAVHCVELEESECLKIAEGVQ